MRVRTMRLKVSVVAFLLVGACATKPKLEMESPGRPAVTWQFEKGGADNAEPDLLAELHDAERTGQDDLALARTLYRLAILRRQEGELSEAEQLYWRALAIQERDEGPDHPDVAATLNNLAAVKVAQGDADAAQPLLERALSIREMALGPENVLTAESLSNLALLEAAQGNAAGAEPLYQRAVSVLEKIGGPGRDQLARVLDNYAALLHDTGRDAAADDLEARARVVRAVDLGSPNGSR